MFRILAAGILGGASAYLAMLAFYGYSKITGREIDFRDPGMYKESLYYVFLVVVAFFTMAVYPSIEGLARVLHRLFA